jgi:hypothetical protein
MTPNQALWQHYHYNGAAADKKSTPLKSPGANAHRDLYYRLQKMNRAIQSAPTIGTVAPLSGKTKWQTVDRQTEDLGLSEL